MRHYSLYCLLYVACFLVGSTLSATTKTTFATLYPMSPAPAQDAYEADSPAPRITTDTLPQGRYQVSSFNNGRSTEFMVEDGEIKELRIDGQTIPEEEYADHQEMVEDMIGGNRNSGPMGMTFDVFRDLDGLEMRSERMQRYFENKGEEWEKMGEEMARRFEDMFEFDRQDGSFRFEFDSEDGEAFEFNLDSLMMGRTYRLLPDGTYRRDDFGEGRSFDDIVREKQLDTDDAEKEIDELETMIEQMERRKAEVQDRIREEEKDAGFTYNGFDFQRELNRLRGEGFLPPGVIRSFEFNQKYLKINDVKADDDAHEVMMRRYREKVNVGKKISIELDGLEW